MIGGVRAMRQLALLAILATGCGGSPEPEVVASCTSRGEREAVCTCAAARLEEIVESETYDRYVHVVRGARRLAEEQDLAGRMDQLDRSDLDQVYALQERMKASFVIAGREIGLDRVEVFELLDTVERKLQSAIEECRS